MSKLILVVEDQEDNRQIIRDLLLTLDYELAEAENGVEALAAVAKQKPDLILMDISLPVMDGYAATREIRKTMSSTPIIGLSAHAMQGDADKAKEAGCNDYMTKPINEDLLIMKMQEYLG